MSQWILGIVCIVCLGVLLDIILPEGETNKYIKGIFSIATILCIVSPLPKLIENGFNFSQDGGVFDFSVDDNFLSGVESSQKKQLQKQVIKLLEDSGNNVQNVSIKYNIKDVDKIEKVSIYLKNLVINNENPHKDIVAKVKKLCSEYLKIDKEKIFVYGYG